MSVVAFSKPVHVVARAVTSRATLAWTLCIGLLSLRDAPSIRADAADITLLGDQANLMAGAVIASTQAGPSMWYNPARLPFSSNKRLVFAVSGVGAAMRLYRIPALITTPRAPLDATTSELLPLPRATTLIVRGRGGLHWGIGLFIPTRQDIRIQAGVQTTGTTADFSAYGLRLRRSSYHLTGSVSYTLNDRIQFGLSLGAVAYSYFNMSQFSTAAYDSTTGVASTLIISAAQHDVLGYGIRPTLGLSVELPEGWTVGLSAAPPTVLFYSRLDQVSTRAGTGAAGVVEVDPSLRGERAGVQLVEPGAVRLGLSYSSARALWEIDGELTGGASSEVFSVDERVTGNVRAGGVVGLQEQLRIGFGFFTDLAPRKRALNELGDTHMRGLGGTLGINFVSRLPGQERSDAGTYSITLATRYAHYKGQVVGLSVAQAGQLDSLVTTPVDGTLHELSGQVGINGAW